MARGLTIFGTLLVLTGLSQAAYLPDYGYIQGVGWLRLHIVPATWADAQLRCHLEDATLTAPTTSAITAVMKTAMRAHRLAESSVFTDIYASNPKGDYTSVNGLPMSNISLQWAVGEPNNLGNNEDCLVMTGAGELADVSCSSVHPFFCLKRNATSNCDQCDNTYRVNQCNNVQIANQCDTAHIVNECNCTSEANQCSTTQEVKQCDTKAPGYTLEPRTGSCYKFHRTGSPWYHADMQCASERAYLAVINSDVESQVLKELFAQNPPETIMKSHHNDYAHIGFLDWKKTGEWLTVFGETLEEACFNQWNVNEPKNYGGVVYCGSWSRSGKLNDISCITSIYPYICEITPKQNNNPYIS